MYRYLLMLVLSCSAYAECDAMFINNERPELDDSGVEICFDEFAVLYSSEYKAPIYAVQVLTPLQIAGAESINRDDAFHSEPKANNEVKPSDYRHSGYDKGHLAPAGDMSNTTAQYQSFSMANMVPQTPQNNRDVWRHIETNVRNIAESLKQGEKLYVVTGAVFSNDKMNGIRIPQYLYKAIYSPSSGSVGVFVAMNDASKACSVMSLEAFTEMSGIVPFPDIPSGMLQKIAVSSTK